MKPSTNEPFLLVYIYRGLNTVIDEGLVSLMQKKKTELKNLPQYKSGILQVRRKKAYAKVKQIKQK